MSLFKRLWWHAFFLQKKLDARTILRDVAHRNDGFGGLDIRGKQNMVETGSEYIPLAIPSTGELERRNLNTCIDTNFVSTVGSFVKEFEEKIARLSGVEYGVSTGAGTQALHMAMRALRLGEGDLVILPSLTFIASANAVRHANADVWLMDVSANDWTLDPVKVAEALKLHTHLNAEGECVHTTSQKRVKAIMPVYTLGTPADMEALNDIAKAHNLYTIADAAAAIGVDYQGKAIGKMADITCYSFNGNKTITCGGGGMAVGADEATMTRLRHLTTTARVSPDYDHDEVGFNYRMTNIAAAVGCAQLEQLEGFLATKRHVRKTYDEAFGNDPRVSLFPLPKDRGSTCWFSGLVLEEGVSKSVAEICQYLHDEEIEARPFWKPLHLQMPYESALCENVDYTMGLWQRILTLPCSSSITDNQLERVIAAVNKAMK